MDPEEVPQATCNSMLGCEVDPDGVPKRPAIPCWVVRWIHTVLRREENNKNAQNTALRRMGNNKNAQNTAIRRMGKNEIHKTLPYAEWGKQFYRCILEVNFVLHEIEFSRSQPQSGL